MSWTGIFSAPPSAPPRRPGLALRIGITGTRRIEPDQVARLRDELRQVFNIARREIEAVALRRDLRDPKGRRAAEAAYDTGVPPWIRLVTPLAEGADRLAADVARECGVSIAVAMPFRKELYQATFATPDSNKTFENMLSWAGGDVLELDGADATEDEPMNRAMSYDAVGRFVVHNCDLLIAIWDGKPPCGWGGTADVVRHATESATPVWHIHATAASKSPRWIEAPFDLRAPFPPAAPVETLQRYLRGVLTPPVLSTDVEIDETAAPATGARHGHSVLERVLLRDRSPVHHPLWVYLNEPAPRSWLPWKLHPGLIRLASLEKPKKRYKSKICFTGDIAEYWRQYRGDAKARADSMGDRFRSVYVWVFLLVAFSLVVAESGLVCKPIRHPAGWVELGAFVAILILVSLNIRRDWHQRWIDSRLLSEMCRSQEALGTLGWTLPGQTVANLMEIAVRQEGRKPHDRTAWVAWFFAACVRAAPFPREKFPLDMLMRYRSAMEETLMEGQYDYHLRRNREYRRAASHLAIFGEVLFALVMVCVAIKQFIGHDSTELILGWLAAAIPAIAAASIGIRLHAELMLQAEQSRQLASEMQRAWDQSWEVLGNHTKPFRPLASQELGAITHRAATAMMRDVDGWSRTFRVKVVEAG